MARTLFQSAIALAFFLVPVMGATLPVTAAQAGQPITAQMGEAYYQNCMTGVQKEGTMSDANQKAFCACTALEMQKNMTVEDLQALNSTGAPARAALNKVLTSVQAPCMEFPVHDMLGNKCSKDIGNPKICNCLSGKMSSFVQAQAVALMGKILAANPNTTDPMSAIMESADFQQEQQRIALSCAAQ